MPIHPDVASRFRYLDGLPSLREAYGDPELIRQIRQIRQFETWEPTQGPPAVRTRDEPASGPHGPVPLRIYTPSGELSTLISGRPYWYLREMGWADGKPKMISERYVGTAAEVEALLDAREERMLPERTRHLDFGAVALAGVDVRQVQVKTMLHGFLNLPADLEPVRAALDLMASTVSAAGC